MKNLYVSWSKRPFKETFLRQLKGILESYEENMYLGVKKTDMQLSISPMLYSILNQFVEQKTSSQITIVDKILGLTLVKDASMNDYSMELKIKDYKNGKEKR